MGRVWSDESRCWSLKKSLHAETKSLKSRRLWLRVARAQRWKCLRQSNVVTSGRNLRLLICRGSSPLIALLLLTYAAFISGSRWDKEQEQTCLSRVIDPLSADLWSHQGAQSGADQRAGCFSSFPLLTDRFAPPQLTNRSVSQPCCSAAGRCGASEMKAFAL